MVGYMFHIKHLTDNLWGWWWGQHELTPYFENGTQILWRSGSSVGHEYVNREDIVDDWNPTKYYSKFKFSCADGVTVVMLLRPTNSTLTIGEAWDAGAISYVYNYDIDWSKTGVNVWSIVAQLLTFSNFDLGIGGVGGTILNGLVLGGYGVMIVFIAYKITTGIIPWFSGGSGD
jgi:hypothetical protein